VVLDADGAVGWNPGKLNPNIIRPVSPIDPEVGVVYFETPDKKPVLTYVNFALHADTTGGTGISADYPGALARRLADCKGPDMMTIFANGACGNLNHVNVNWAGAQTSPAEANRLGTILAARPRPTWRDRVARPRHHIASPKPSPLTAIALPQEDAGGQGNGGKKDKAKLWSR
jgi:hypothetical protein